MPPVKPSVLDSDLARREEAAVILKAIDAAKKEINEVKEITRQEIDEVAEKYSRAPSTFLAAVVGGGVGAAGGVAVGTFGGGIVILTGPIGLAVGAALAVLAFRGRSYRRLEKATLKAKKAVDVIRDEIKKLPPKTPKEIQEQLWKQYGEIMAEYSRIAKESIDE